MVEEDQLPLLAARMEGERAVARGPREGDNAGGRRKGMAIVWSCQGATARVLPGEGGAKA